jgi:hypothetical protein
LLERFPDFREKKTYFAKLELSLNLKIIGGSIGSFCTVLLNKQVSTTIFVQWKGTPVLNGIKFLHGNLNKFTEKKLIHGKKLCLHGQNK